MYYTGRLMRHPAPPSLAQTPPPSPSNSNYLCVLAGGQDEDASQLAVVGGGADDGGLQLGVAPGLRTQRSIV